MKIFNAFSLIAIIVLAACQTPTPEVTPNTFSGTIENGEVDTVYLYNSDHQVKLAVDSGKFGDTIELGEGYYTLRIGRETTAMYWDSAFQIGMSINLKEFDESVEYSGYGAYENNVLAKSYLLIEEKTGKELFSKFEDEFLLALKDLKSELQGLLGDPHGSKTFKEEQRQNAIYYYNSYLYSYPSYHKYYNKLDSFEVSAGYYDQIEPFEKDLASTFERSSSYRELLNSYVQHQVRERTESEGGFVPALRSTINEFSAENIKNSILSQYSYQLLKPSEDLDERFELLKVEISDTAALRRYTEGYEKLSKLKKGMPSPSFEGYENHAGGTTSLADLKGKFVYIDVWATWCGPCLREIPSLKEVEADYHKANITFLSLSIDKEEDHDTWVDMVNEKELGGMQLFADNDWSSQFIKDYYIRGIPRFILLDPEGKIIDADAPRPSDPQLRTLLDGVLKPV